MSKTKYTFLRIFLHSAKTRGLLPALSWAVTVAKGNLKKVVREHYTLIRWGLLGLAATMAGVAAWFLVEGELAPSRARSVMFAGALLLAFFVGVIAVLTHVLLPSRLRAQVLLQTIQAGAGVVVVSALGAIGYHAWMQAYARAPGAATLFGLVIVVAVMMFMKPIHTMLRFLLIRFRMAEIEDIPSLTPEGLHRIAVHEAGHAVCYGLGNQIPEDAMAMLNSDVYGILAGMVDTPMPNDPTELTRNIMDWNMLVSVAGRAAEEAVFEDPSMTTGMDMQSFQRIAILYLQAGFAPGWRHDPETDADHRVNQEALDLLAGEYLERADELVALNRGLIDNVAALLQEREFLGCEELQELLKGFVLPDGWSRFNWPASVPVLPATA